MTQNAAAMITATQTAVSMVSPAPADLIAWYPPGLNPGDPPAGPRREPDLRSAVSLVRRPVPHLIPGPVQNGPDPLGPVGETCLGAAAGWLIVPAPDHLIRRVLLRDDALLDIMRVLVVLAMAEARGARVVGIAQVRGHWAGQPGADVLPGRPDSLHHRVGLGASARWMVAWARLILASGRP